MPKKSQPQKQKPVPVPLMVTRDGEAVILSWLDLQTKRPIVRRVLVTRDTYNTIGLRLGIPEIDPDIRSFLEDSYWRLDPSDRCWFSHSLDMLRRRLQAQGRN